MIEIKKPVARNTRDEYTVLRSCKARRIVVTLAPGDLLEFREQGCRLRWSLDIETAFKIAVRCSANMGLCFVPLRKQKAVAA